MAEDGGNIQSGLTARSVRLEGIAASPGVAVGRAFPVDRRRIRTPKYHIALDEVEDEMLRLSTALKLSEYQLEEIKSRLKEEGEGHEHLLILEAHRLMLRDDMLVDAARDLIREELINAEWAIRRTVKRIKRVFDNIDHEYFRERRGDVDFVGDRIIRNLMGQVVDFDEIPPEDAIIVAHDLSPADTVMFARHKVLGIVTDVGAKTSHSAIVARALEIPAAVGVGRASEVTGRGDTMIVDGTHGVVILSPTPHEIDEYRAARRRYIDYEQRLLSQRELPAETRDGRRVEMLGNIEFAAEIPSVLSHGGEGVGLYRTEFLYLNRKDLPTEDEHYEVYKAILEQMGERPVTIRTFDLGGDKVPLGGRAREPNPAMGLRAIRLCMRRPEIFMPQLRALLRAGVHGNLKIMFPMISGPAELKQAKGFVEQAMEELSAEGRPFREDVPIGIMVELPSAAVLADRLAADAAFFSIGTNDLIQYSLGIDRQNRDVAYLYKPLHLAVLRTIKHIVDAAHAQGIPVSMCGEMAGEPMYTAVLLALGLDGMSMNAVSIPIVKQIIRTCTLDAAREILDEAMSFASVEEIDRYVRSEMLERFSSILQEAI